MTKRKNISKKYHFIGNIRFDKESSNSIYSEMLGTQSQQYGRHIVTNKDLTPSQILCMEDPYETSLIKECIYGRCANCWTSNLFNLLPCEL